MKSVKNMCVAAGVVVALAGLPSGGLIPQAVASGNPAAKKPDYPPFNDVIKGLTKVVSTTDGSKGFYDLYKDDKTGRLLGVLPSGYDKKLQMIACTVAGGDGQAGVMGPTHYVKWEKIGKQLALVAPNLNVRTEGDAQAKASIEQLYTGRVMLSMPIMSMAPGNRPVIDLGMMATAQASKFFGGSVFGGYGPSLAAMNPKLAKLTKAKSFPQNVEIKYRAPDPSGRLVEIAYSINELKGTPGFKPRKADSRVGYFYNWHNDYAKQANLDVTDRYITRWHLEKADPSLKISPPKEPIVWYIEHTTPVKFRQYVREGIEMWNKAYEAIGIVGALEVRQQDASSGAFMDIDPEDARYNFFRWNTSSFGYAIGPSRTNPFTGEILDADVVWHQGLTRSLRGSLENLSDSFTEDTFNAETLAFFEEHPDWDPRVRLSGPESQRHRMARIAMRKDQAVAMDLGDPNNPWTPMTHDLSNTACKMGNMLAMDFALAGAALQAGLLDTGDDDVEMLEGVPEAFYSQIIRYISAHEVGHCLGLQHNMTASTINTLEEINSPGFSGPLVGSVMEYAAVNLNHNLGEVQGPYATTEVGPYDMWAIAYGYGPKSDLDDVLSRVSEPGNIWVPQVAMVAGADPRNVTWDMGADNLEFARSRLGLAAELRGKLIDDIVEEGEPWSMARKRFGSLLGTHIYSLVIASNWIGGSFYNTDFKGDPGARTPIEDVPAARQREALGIIIDNSFNDGAFGITPELVRHLGKDHWWDPSGLGELMSDPSLTVHDLVGGVQATALSLVMNPSTLRRVYDNEFRSNESTPFTLAELVSTVTNEAWSEMDSPARGFEVSSFRRNLQREHLGRLTTLALLDGSSPSLRTIATLATAELRRIDKMAESGLGARPDAYTQAHLQDIRTRVAKTLDAAYVIGR